MCAMDGTNIFSNINLFLNSLELQPEIEEELRKFPRLSLDEKNKLYGSEDSTHQFCLIRDNKEYYFNAFSSLDIEKRDREHIKNKDYSSNELILKTLEIAGYPTMINSKFIFATSDDELTFLVEYYKDGKYYIINLEYDLIMEKDKYYELKSVNEITVLNKSQIYFLYCIFPKLKTEIPIMYFILFFDEMMPILTKYETFKLEGYDKEGINYKNYFLFMSGCDSMFKYCLKEYQIPDFQQINSLTIENSRQERMINEEGKLVYGDYAFEKFSDYVIDEEKRNFLQTEERFGICHSFAKYVLLTVYRNKKKKNKSSTIRLVNGIVFYQTKYLVYHSWVEFMYKGVLMVADLTQNLLMEKEMYYRYTKAHVISTVDGPTMDELNEFLRITELITSHRLNDFFAQELLAEFKKNEKILIPKREDK